MRLETVILKNFRSYQEETRIPIGDLTTFIGRNDVGKSSILEALEIFFNNKLVKIEPSDACIRSEDKKVEIGCEFSGFDDEIVIDATAPTSLEQEYLLNTNGNLEVRQVFNCGGASRVSAPSIFARALHPTTEGANDLLHLKVADLRKRLDDLGIDDDTINRTSNVSMRQGIYRSFGNLDPEEQSIDLDKEDAKRIWGKLREALPIYALFQSDRPSKDDDAEVQDPMKLALKEVLEEARDGLAEIETQVRRKMQQLAGRTIEKLREMDATLAQELVPHFKDDPKWDKAFTFSLTDDQQVPINKRGSGVRRLILINFFRADAERRREQESKSNVIYAIEEPETSQHPDNQRLLVDALKELSSTEGAQVLLTTHVPGLAEQIPTSSVRFLSKVDDAGVHIECGSNDPDEEDELFSQISDSLGILPNTNVRLLVCVEGPNDVEFLKRISQVARQIDESVPDLNEATSVAFLPLGGSNIRQWVEKRYLRRLNYPEVHIYDRDGDNPPKYQATCDEVNGWAGGRGWATLTSRRTIENYLHRDAIQEVYGDVPIEAFAEEDDVAELVARAVHQHSGTETPWDELAEEKQKKKKERAKKRLNTEACSNMTPERLQESDPNEDVLSWLREIHDRANQ